MMPLLTYLAFLAVLIYWNRRRCVRRAKEERMARALQTHMTMETAPEEDW